MSLALEPMPAERFDAWRGRTAARFAALRRDSGMLPPTEARDQGEGILASRLPDGVHSADQHVWEIRDAGRLAGTAWLEVRTGDDARTGAMLYALDADPTVAPAAVALLERHAAGAGAQTLRIDLFAQDDAGRRAIEGRGYRASSIQMLLAPLPAPRPPSGLRLTRMDARQYEVFAERLIAEFAHDLEREGQHSAASARAESERQTAEALPDGVDTEDELLFVAHADGPDEPVGVVWLSVQRRSTGPHVFVLELRVEAAHRRRGHGRAIMRAAEDEARRLGADSIGLHVFGFNAAAIALYEDLGYRQTEVLSVKDLRGR